MSDTIPQDTPQDKQCCTCKQFFPATLEHFHSNKRKPDHLSPRCKPCARLKLQKSRAKPRTHSNIDEHINKPIVPDGYKRCYKCKCDFPMTLEFFYSNAGRGDGFSSRCKSCQWLKEDRPFIPEGHQRCAMCKRILPATSEHFHQDAHSHGKHKLRNRCKDCFNLTSNHSIPSGYKVCSNCNKMLEATTDNFHRDKTGKYKLNQVCITCRNGREHPQYQYPPEGTLKQCSQCKQHKVADLVNFISDADKPGHLGVRCKECVSANRKTDHMRSVFRVASALRRSRKKKIPGKYTVQDVRDQYQRQKGRCYYCKVKVGKEYHVDHIIPITREGSSNHKWNIVIACSRCNTSKHNKLPHEWPQGGRLL